MADTPKHASADEELAQLNERVKKRAIALEFELKSFGIRVWVREVNYLKAHVQYCLEVAMGVRIQKIVDLRNEIALALNTPPDTIEFQIPVPGRGQLGIQVPRAEAEETHEPVRVVIEHITKEVPVPAPTLVKQVRNIGAGLCYGVGNLLYAVGERIRP